MGMLDQVPSKTLSAFMHQGLAALTSSYCPGYAYNHIVQPTVLSRACERR